MISRRYRSRQRPHLSQSSWSSVDYRTHERGKSPAWRMGVWPWGHAKSGGLSTLDFKREKIHARICHGSPDLDLYIGANKPASKFDTEGVLHYTKVLPRETSPQYPKPPSFISKLNKIAGHSYIDTPGTVYLEVFVDSPQGCIVLSFSFAGATVQKDQRTCGYLNDWEFARVVNGDGL